MRRNIFRVLTIFLVVQLFSACSSKTKFDLESEKVAEIIQISSDSIQVKQYFPDQDVRSYLHQEFDDFYASREYQLAWVSFDEPLSESQQLLAAIDKAGEEGLEPESYRVSEIEDLMLELFQKETKKERRKKNRARVSKDEEIFKEANEQDTVRLHKLVKLDFLLTSTYLTYASHLLSGKIDPNEEEAWFTEPRKKDLSAHLADALQKNNIEESLTRLIPKHKNYQLLKEALALYRNIADSGFWKPLPQEVGWEPGDKGDGIVQLKSRLVASGDLQEKALDSGELTAFDDTLMESLQNFQTRHGLEASGELNKETMAALNVPVEEVISQIKLNMERMRWLPDEFGEDYLLVNIPDYSLKIYEKGEKTMEMKVIVGEDYTATPVFSDTMEYIVFSPTWTVPVSIASEEMLPMIQEDIDYLEKNNLTVYENWNESAEPLDPKKVKWDKIEKEEFNFRVVEAPGNANSLGRVKFMFPNNLAIYLHDTPAGHLFQRSERNFSHGCIRVEKPVELASYLLEGSGNWPTEKIAEAMQQEEPEQVNLEKKLPVHLVYWTAWVDENGKLNFREDIYDHDQKQKNALELKEKKLLSKR